MFVHLASAFCFFAKENILQMTELGHLGTIGAHPIDYPRMFISILQDIQSFSGLSSNTVDRGSPNFLLNFTINILIEG